MFAAAAIAAAFTAKTPLDAVKAGMTQIPETSELYSALEFAVNQEGKLKDYAHARAILDEKFNGMHCVHTINNMCARGICPYIRRKRRRRMYIQLGRNRA